MGVFIRGWQRRLDEPAHVALQLVGGQTIAEPIDANEAKLSAKLQIGDDDALVPKWITAARRKVENDTGLLLPPQTWDVFVDGFPSGRIWRLPLPPLRAVTSVKYYDATGTLQTLDPSTYLVDAVSRPGRLLLTDAGVWPTAVRRSQPVVIRIEAGWAAVDQIPAELVVAVRLAFGWLVTNREPTTFERQGYDDWIAPYLQPVLG